MRTGSGQAGDSPAAGRQAEPATSSPFATTRSVAWHSDLAAWVDRLGSGLMGRLEERWRRRQERDR